MDTAAPPPRVLATGIGSGLLLMAVFTMWWASDTFTGWPTPVAASVSAVCGLGAIVFAAHAVRLLLADAAAWPLVWSWVGAGAAVVTLAYGIHMTRAARRLLRATAGVD